VVVAIGLPVLLAVAAVVIAVLTSGTPPLAVPAIPAPAAGSAECGSLLDRLPGSLESSGRTLERRTLADPAPPGTAAWGSDESPVTLRCGLDRPAELTRTATLLDVSGVRWLRLPGNGTSTWVAADRAVYVAITFTDDHGTGPLQDVSAAITEALPQQRVTPG
jgi:hypothetical protein